MPEFDRKEFGRRLQAFRKQIGRSQENLGRVIKKSATTIGRFEKGTLLPNAEEIYLLCNELGIEEYQLFNSFNKVISKKESINPFNTNTLYVYYIGYYPTLNKYDKCKFVINLIEKSDYCKIELADCRTKKIYLEGYLQSDNLMKGAFYCTDTKYNTSARKCLVSKNNLDFTDEMLAYLKIQDKEFSKMENINIWYIEMENKEDFEY